LDIKVKHKKIGNIPFADSAKLEFVCLDAQVQVGDVAGQLLMKAALQHTR